MRRSILLLVFILSIILPNLCASQPGLAPSKTITIHFHYGSRPATGHEATEPFDFGGIHGGHVLLQMDSNIFSFYPSGERFHIFAHKKEKHGKYVLGSGCPGLNKLASAQLSHYHIITFLNANF